MTAPSEQYKLNELFTVLSPTIHTMLAENVYRFDKFAPID